MPSRGFGLGNPAYFPLFERDTIATSGQRRPMSSLSVKQVNDIFDQLCRDYEYLSDNRNKLDEDCNKLHGLIRDQLKQVDALNKDFEEMRRTCAQYGLTFAKDPGPPEPAPAAAEEVIPLVPIEQIPKPLNITLIEEIVDISVICSTAFSPDGTCLAIGSDKTLRVFNIETDDFVLQYTLEDTEEGTTNHVRSIAWTNDNKRVVCGGEDGHVRVFQLPDGAILHNIVVGSGEISQLQITNNGELLAVVVAEEAVVKLFKMSDLTNVATLARPNVDPTVVATSLSISPDDKWIAVGYGDCICALWDIETQQLLSETPCHGNKVYDVKFLPNKNRLVTASLDSTIKIWDIVTTTGKPTLELWKSLCGHQNYVLSLATDPAGEWLLSGSKDLTAHMSYLETGEMIYSIKGHMNSVITVAVSPSGNVFCTGSGDQTVKIWAMNPEEAQEISS